MLTAAFPLLLFSFFVSSSSALSPPAALRQLLSDTSTCHLMPCCYDGISARLVASSKADFKVTFQTGFGVSAAAGYSDSGVLGLSENAAAAFVVGEALGNVALSLNRAPLPCIADGDTGHGSPLAIRRTIFQFAKARMAGVMIEDQVSPKRCGHVDGKEVVDREEAVRRVKIACDARDDYEKLYGAPGPLILARTDARGVSGGTLEEAIERCLAFREAGADITFLEAPQSVGEMSEYCSRVKGPKLYNALEGGKTPILGQKELTRMGYSLAAYPLSLLSASVRAMEECLEKIGRNEVLEEGVDLKPFKELKQIVGFDEVEEMEERYRM